MPESGTIRRALNVLREALPPAEMVQTKGVALALWVLRDHCPDEWLTFFWDAAGTEHDIGRSQNMNAAFHGIVRQLKMRGYQE